MAILWLLLSIILILLVLGYIFSLLLTRRHTPDETRSPAEYGLAFDEVAFPARDGVTLRGWWIPAAPTPTLPCLATREGHGERDPYIPPADSDALVAAANEPKEIWRVPEAGHRMVDQVYPEEYRRRVVAFFEQHL
jgi:pimeloyl-ACP methyl ester carboxylesterase